MKKVWNELPAWLKVVIYFIVLSIATLIAGVVPMLDDLIFFFVISLAMSWLFLHMESLSLSTLRCWPIDRRDWQRFFAGIGIGALMLICTVIITLSLSGDTWHFNRHVDPVFIAMGFLFNLWSAYVQEFVFRGYPFQVLLRSYMPWIAQLIIALPFGLMHVHKGMSPTDIIVTMLTTGIGSLLFGLAYLKTKGLMLPVGIHMGWNFLQSLVPRTAGGIDKGLIVVSTSHITYGFSVVVLPYFVIMAIAFILLFRWRACSKA